jgi:hypothetical protein
MSDVAVVGNWCLLFCSKGVVEVGLRDGKIIVSMGAVSSNVKWKLLAGRKVRKQYVCLKGAIFSQQSVCVCVCVCVHTHVHTWVCVYGCA